MDGVAEVFREQRELLAELDAHRDQIIATILDFARNLDASDREAAAELLETAEQIGRREQAAHGQLILLLAQADRVRAAKGGVKAWVATHLDTCDGRARGIAESARRIGAIPELAEPLSSGRIGADTVRALTRTAKAVAGTGRDTTAALTATLATVEREGVTAAKKQIQILEHTLDPGRGEDLIARQRRRSFFRVVELGDGSAIDVQSADWIRRAQYDHEQPLPEDVGSTEQINAHALVRLAEVFHIAPPKVREARFSPTVLYFHRARHRRDRVRGPDSALGDRESRRAPARDRRGRGAGGAGRGENRHRTDLAAGQPGTANHTGLPRPTLHLRRVRAPDHLIPFSNGGPTVMKNLTLLCPNTTPSPTESKRGRGSGPSAAHTPPPEAGGALLAWQAQPVTRVLSGAQAAKQKSTPRKPPPLALPAGSWLPPVPGEESTTDRTPPPQTNRNPTHLTAL